MRFLSFKLLKSPKNAEQTPNRNPKDRIFLNLYHFATGDNKKHSGLEIEFMIDPGSTCTIINYPTFFELMSLGQHINIQNSGNITRSYNGSEIKMLGYTILTSYFDTDGKYEATQRVWVTEEKKCNILGIDFCHTFLESLIFGIPAVELKGKEKGVLSYGSLNNEKEYPQVSQINAVIITQPLYIPPKSTFLYKHKSPLSYPYAKGTSFVPHKNTIKTRTSI